MRAKALKYASEALSDLTEIRSYLNKEAGSKVSARVLTRIKRTIDAARDQPEAGVARPHYRPDCCFVKQPPYLIYYDFDGATMIVLRILHAAQDRDSIMGG